MEAREGTVYSSNPLVKETRSSFITAWNGNGTATGIPWNGGMGMGQQLEWGIQWMGMDVVWRTLTVVSFICMFPRRSGILASSH